MTKKHYQMIAAVLTQYKSDACALSIAISLAHAFKHDNPAFDPRRFLAACGINDYDTSWIERCAGR